MNDRIPFMANLASRIQHVQGDIVECGVHHGESLVAVAQALPGRRVWAYDSWQGFPPAGPQDCEEAHTLTGWGADASAEAVRQRLVGICGDGNVVMREGWFQDTFQLPKPEQIAFLSIDCDWYDSVRKTLHTFYDRVSDQGIVTLDDFGGFAGCRKAFYDWCSDTGEKPLLLTFGLGQSYWQKGRESVRHGDCFA